MNEETVVEKMMKVSKHELKTTYFIRLTSGEEVLSSIKTFAEKETDLGGGVIQAIGAVSEVTLGFFDGKSYIKKTFAEDLEIISILGNIAFDEAGNTIVHIHGSFGKKDYSVIGGHIFSAITSATCEIQISSIQPRLKRSKDPLTGLVLLDLPQY